VCDSEQPLWKTFYILKVPQTAVGLQERVLTDIERIFAVADRSNDITEDTPFPASDQHVERIDIASASLQNQISVFNIAEDQCSSPPITTTRRMGPSKSLTTDERCNSEVF
jgi:hypothetical protein